MRISHKYKFIYLSKPRCASTSIRQLLNPYSDVTSVSSGPYYHHTTARDLKTHFQKMGWNWTDYYKFITIRNPWDLLVSFYHFGKPDANNLFWWEDGKNGIKYNPKNRMGFNELMKNRSFQWHTLDNFILDKHNKSLVDCIIKVEDIESGIRDAFNKIGLPITDIPKINSTRHKNYRQYYTNKIKIKVAKIFSYDIQIGGYEF